MDNMTLMEQIENKLLNIDGNSVMGIDGAEWLEKICDRR